MNIAIAVNNETDPLRAELASAIAVAAEAKNAAAAAEDAVARGRELLEQAERKHEAAKGALAGARESDARHVVDSVKRRGAASGGGETRRARDAIADSDDAAQVALAAVDQLSEAAAEADAQLQWALNRVLTARNALLADLAAKLLERGRAARLEAVLAENIITEFLYNKTGAPDFSDTLDKLNAADRRDEPLRAIKREAEYFLGSGVGDGERAAINQTVAAVRGFIAALETDASAEPPAFDAIGAR